MKNDDDMADALKDDSGAFDIKKMGAGVLTACTLFSLLVVYCSILTGFPGPVLMIVLSPLFLKYLNVVPAETHMAPNNCINLFPASFTFPLMAGLGLFVYSIERRCGNTECLFFLVVISVVFTVIATGVVVSRFMNTVSHRSRNYFCLSKRYGRHRRLAILSTR